MLILFISLLIGLIIGYLGQRSRMCFIGGIRDFILVRDTFLLKGFIAFFLTALILFMLTSYLGGDTPDYPWFAREKASESEEIARTRWAYAACWIPDEVLFSMEKEKEAQSLKLPGGILLSYTGLLALIGGLGIGIFSTLANGCPFRQHVMAGQGNKSAWVYLAGFYFGIIIYQFMVAPFFDKLTG